MKKRNIVFRVIILITMIAFLGSCASTHKSGSTGDYIDDSVITTKVKAQIASNDFLKSFQISVETSKGIVQLSGFVDSEDAAEKADEIANGVEGVSSVENDLIIK
ncbi:MAG: BON domain-containing protein [Candidatus Delongbacteria bacterium]|nr:BON domain-containing protein [Candidatus Delongbacteria bacterium]